MNDIDKDLAWITLKDTVSEALASEHLTSDEIKARIDDAWSLYYARIGESS